MRSSAAASQPSSSRAGDLVWVPAPLRAVADELASEPERPCGVSDGELVRRAGVAEGQGPRTVAAEQAGRIPCRCVVRGREARDRLQAYDCDQCRAFYGAVGLASNVRKGGVEGLRVLQVRASRHRYEYAPAWTPPGFWDLSFPREGGSTGAPARQQEASRGEARVQDQCDAGSGPHQEVTGMEVLAQ